jgi:hypothetical protein
MTADCSWIVHLFLQIYVWTITYHFMAWRPGIAVSVTQRHCVLSLSRDILNHELPSLSPVSIDNEKLCRSHEQQPVRLKL